MEETSKFVLEIRGDMLAAVRKFLKTLTDESYYTLENGEFGWMLKASETITHSVRDFMDGYRACINDLRDLAMRDKAERG